MMFRRAVISILAILILFCSSSCTSNKMERYETEFSVLFDTQTQVIQYTDSEDEFEAFSDLVYDNMEEYHQLFDIYNLYDGINNLKTINDNAGITPVKVDKRIIDLLSFGKEWYEKTDGKMNIAYGAVLKIWHDYRSAGIDNPDKAELPPLEMLKAASEHTDINKIIIDKEASTVFLEDPLMSIDAGAIGKGYAVEQVSIIAQNNGYTSGLINAGGNIKAIGGKKNSETKWNVGIKNPYKVQNDYLEVVELKDMSLVTSGNYERYYTVGGKNYSHIIDPDTLFPSEYFSSVTIIAKNSGIADALSTAIFNMPFEQGLALVENTSGVEAIWLFDNGEKRYSSGLARYIQD